MKIICLAILISFALFQDSCKKESCACGFENTRENLPWLKHFVDQVSPSCYEVYSFVFEKKEYISIANCEGTPDGMKFMYDCQGNRTFSYGGISGAPTNYGMPDTFTVEFYLSHRKLLFITQ
jgi:hypothetical protein